MKKLFLSLLIVLSLFTVVGCSKDDTKNDDTNKDNTNDSSDEIPELTTKYTESIKLDFTYEGLDFISDGVGEAELVRCTDGDTATFRNNGNTFVIRFLGINTPESTARFEPWGKAASTYTCDKLTNAETIVLQSDSGSERTDGNGRYLGWVWYDGTLLNLELVEQAYSQASGASDTYYEQTLYLAEFAAQETFRRIWGEIDPDYDYSLEGVQLTIEELVKNQDDLVGNKVVITGVISRVIKGSPYIQQDGYGVYLYKGYVNTSKLVVGNEVKISALTLTYYPDAERGSLQLSGLYKSNIDVLSEGNVVEPTTLTIPTLTNDNLGSLVRMENLEVMSVDSDHDGDGFTINCKDSSGNEIAVRRDDSVDSDLVESKFPQGMMFDVVAPVSKYYGELQLNIVNIEDITFK